MNNSMAFEVGQNLSQLLVLPLLVEMLWEI